MIHARSSTTAAFRRRGITRIAFVAILLAALLAVPWTSAFADDSGAGQPAATPIADSSIPANQDVAATSTPTSVAAVDETTVSTPTPTAVASPELTYAPNAKPTCRVDNGEPAAVAAGGSVVYRCDYGVVLTGAHLASSWIALDWAVNVSSPAGWTAQLSPIADGAPDWTAAGAATARLEAHGGIDHAAEAVVDAFTGDATFAFRLRLTRPDCGGEAPDVSLALSVVASLPGHDDAAVSPGADQPAPHALTPKLAALVETAPAVTIASYAVAPVTFSLADQTTRAELTIAVDNPVHQCRDWLVTVDVRSFVGESVNGAVRLRSIGALQGAPDSGFAAADDPGDGPFIVAVIGAGAEPGQFTQTIALDLTIPGKTSSGAYQSSASATVSPEP